MRIGGSGAIAITGREWESVVRGLTFSAYMLSGATAAEYSKCQILNPAASGVLVYVTRAYLGNGEVGWIAQNDTALATAVTDLGSKALAAAAPVATLFTGTEVALDTPYFALFDSEAGSTKQYPYTDPWVLAEGEGLVWQYTSVNVALSLAALEWVEVAL